MEYQTEEVMMRKDFGMRLRELRKKAGMTQKQVADYFWCSPQKISLYESGDREPSIPTLCRLMKLFHASPQQLFIGEA